MVGTIDIVIVSLIAIGSTALIGVLGYLMDKVDEDQPGDPKHEDGR